MKTDTRKLVRGRQKQKLHDGTVSLGSPVKATSRGREAKGITLRISKGT